jgi:hypothetical protein
LQQNHTVDVYFGRRFAINTPSRPPPSQGEEQKPNLKKRKAPSLRGGEHLLIKHFLSQ